MFVSDSVRKKNLLPQAWLNDSRSSNGWRTSSRRIHHESTIEGNGCLPLRRFDNRSRIKDRRRRFLCLLAFCIGQFLLFRAKKQRQTYQHRWSGPRRQERTMVGASRRSKSIGQPRRKGTRCVCQVLLLLLSWEIRTMLFSLRWPPITQPVGYKSWLISAELWPSLPRYNHKNCLSFVDQMPVASVLHLQPPPSIFIHERFTT